MNITLGRAATSVLAYRLCVAIGQLGVRVLAVDGFQRIFDWREPERQKILALLKDVAKDTGISVVLLSTENLEWLRIGSPLSGVFAAPVYLGPFEWRNLHHRQIFLKWLQDVQIQIAPLCITPLNEEMAFRIYCASQGTIGSVMQLIRAAARKASQSKTNEITLPMLAQMYEQCLWPPSNASNPFLNGDLRTR